MTPNQNKSYKGRNLKFDCFFFLKKQEKTVEGLNEDSKKEKVIRITMEKRRSCKSARVSSHSGWRKTKALFIPLLLSSKTQLGI